MRMNALSSVPGRTYPVFSRWFTVACSPRLRRRSRTDPSRVVRAREKLHPEIVQQLSDAGFGLASFAVITGLVPVICLNT
jgi:hypothetical protein